MAGTFPGTSGAQQQGIDGTALDGAILTVFIGGTTVLANVFQDIGLVIPAQNPMTADASGRLPLFFVADGTYRVRLTDKYGSTANGGFDYPQCPSIGASASGGGGNAVDPTTVLSTGDVKWQPIDNVIAGWVRMNGRTIGSATSGSSERASADTSALFAFLWGTFSDAICPVVGGRGVSAVADFGANKQITLIDIRARAPFGLDTMGGAAAGRMVGADFASGDAITPASSGGEAAHVISVAEAPAHTHTITDQGHAHGIAFRQGVTAGGSGEELQNSPSTGSYQSASAQTGIAGTNSTGGGGAHNTMPPFMLGTFFMKL